MCSFHSGPSESFAHRPGSPSQKGNAVANSVLQPVLGSCLPPVPARRACPHPIHASAYFIHGRVNSCIGWGQKGPHASPGPAPGSSQRCPVWPCVPFILLCMSSSAVRACRPECRKKPLWGQAHGSGFSGTLASLRRPSTPSPPTPRPQSWGPGGFNL